MPHTSSHAPSALEAAQAALTSAINSAEAVRISELQYRRLFEAARDGILILESDVGRITDANPFMTELLGYSRDELLGKELWEIGLLQDKEAGQAAFRRLKAGWLYPLRGPAAGKPSRRSARGRVRQQPLPAERSQVIQCNIRDITDRKSHETMLTAEHAHISEILASITDALFALDREWRFTYINAQAEALLKREDLLGKVVWEEFPEAVGSLFDEQYRRAADNMVVVDFESFYAPLDSWFHVRAFPAADGVSVHFTDISSRKRQEAEDAAAAAKNERIADTLQRAMLHNSAKDNFPGIALETLYMAALNEADVGGDFFDAFALSPEKVAFVVGDVSGKGLAAAGRTAEVKYALRAFLHGYHSPEIALGHLNDFICETHRQDNDIEDAFIVLALAVVDTVTGEVAFSASGAEPTLILRASGSVEKLEIRGMPLGISADAAYTLKSTILEVGETVMMATDGIIEARRGRAFLGTDGMAALAEKAGPDATLVELRQAIYGGARDFALGRLRDNVCLLLARRQ